MNSFYTFIKKDIEAKKNSIESLPTKSITARKKVISTINSVKEKYEVYLENLTKYIAAKKKNIIIPLDSTETLELKETIKGLEKARFLLNPYNTYVEKMGFDSLLYEIDNYYTFNFNSLNEIINAFLDKFELAGIKLTSSDFNYTAYVHEYMESFLEVREAKQKSYARVSNIFEQIYWANPELIEHIELNFRKLIRINEKKFNNYIAKEQSAIKNLYKITGYSSCIRKLSDAYFEINEGGKESISDILNKALNKEVDLEGLRPGQKMRIQAYNTLVPIRIDIKDQKAMAKVYEALEKLSDNVEEYIEYLDFIELFHYFKNEYGKFLTPDGVKGPSKELTEALGAIIKKEEELAKLNARISGGKKGFLDFGSEKDTKILKAKSVNIAKELSACYKTYDEEYFKNVVATNFINVMTADDLFTLYYSFDFFKKKAIQNVYNLEEYEKIVELSKKFDNFAQNPNNIVITGISVLNETNVPRIIANKYRLSDINISEDDLSEEVVKSLYNRIKTILRVKKIEDSSITIEELCFVAKAEKILNK